MIWICVKMSVWILVNFQSAALTVETHPSRCSTVRKYKLALTRKTKTNKEINRLTKKSPIRRRNNLCFNWEKWHYGETNDAPRKAPKYFYRFENTFARTTYLILEIIFASEVAFRHKKWHKAPSSESTVALCNPHLAQEFAWQCVRMRFESFAAIVGGIGASLHYCVGETAVNERLISNFDRWFDEGSRWLAADLRLVHTTENDSISIYV